MFQPSTSGAPDPASTADILSQTIVGNSHCEQSRMWSRAGFDRVEFLAICGMATRHLKRVASVTVYSTIRPNATSAATAGYLQTELDLPIPSLSYGP